MLLVKYMQYPRIIKPHAFLKIILFIYIYSPYIPLDDKMMFFWECFLKIFGHILVYVPNTIDHRQWKRCHNCKYWILGDLEYDFHNKPTSWKYWTLGDLEYDFHNKPTSCKYIEL